MSTKLFFTLILIVIGLLILNRVLFGSMEENLQRCHGDKYCELVYLKGL